MERFAALRLRKLPVIHWIKADEFDCEAGSKVLVRTQQGSEAAVMLRFVQSDSPPDSGEPFVREIVRLFDDTDETAYRQLKEKEADVLIKGKKMVGEYNLAMKLLSAEYLFDQTRLIFYFKSESKVDFRELLKAMAASFKTRIELRQIGVRDETKLLGGLGCCGKEVCCSQFMTCFYPVSTKMAKDQNLSLNPAKLSGICGRLLCCLAHEHLYYASFHGKYPKLGAEILVAGERAKIMDLNYITMKALVGFPDRKKLFFDLSLIHGRKEPVTGKNLWWVQNPGEPEPDLSILIPVPPPKKEKKKKKPPMERVEPGTPDQVASDGHSSDIGITNLPTDVSGRNDAITSETDSDLPVGSDDGKD